MAQFAKSFLLGGVSGCVAKTATAPIERVKLLLQTQDNDSPDKYTGMVDCFTRVVKEQGPATFWRGNIPNLVRYFPTQALNFATKERYNKMFVKCSKDENFWKFFFGTLACGGAAGATSMTAVYPLEFARTKMALDKGVGKEKTYDGMVDCINKLYKEEGLFGLYRGFGVSLAGIIAYRAAYFGLYDVGKAVLYSNPAVKPSPLKSFALAFTTDTIAGVTAYPFDTVRRRMMIQGKGDDRKYKNTADCAKKIYQNEGPKAFFKGCGSNILRGLGGACVLVIYDNVNKGAKASTKQKSH